MDLLRGCGILIRLHLNIKVDGNCVFEYEYENVVPTDGAILMKRDFVSRMECAQMGPNSHLDICINEGTASIRVVIGVVLAITPPMPKSKRENVL